MVYFVYLHLLGVLLRTLIAMLCIAVAARLVFDIFGDGPRRRSDCGRRGGTPDASNGGHE